MSAVPAGSAARDSAGGFPQPVHVAHRWDAEEALVLPIKVRGVVVADAVAGAGRVEVLAQQQTAGLLEPQLLLELQGVSAVTALKW